MTGHEQSIHVTWPARKFYWARLDASALPQQGILQRKPSPTQLSYLFENVLPLPVDELQVAFAPISNGKRTHLACGIERSLLAKLPSGTVTLTPSELHEVEGLRDLDGIDPAQLNLLHGDFEPRTVRRLRRQSGIELLAAVLVVAALVTFGLRSRAQTLRNDTLAWREAESEVFQKVLGPPPPPEAGNAGQSQQVQLTVELRRLRQTRRADLPAGDSPSSDVIGTLARLLHRWPMTNGLTQSLSISPGRIAIRAALPDAEQAQAFVEALEPLPDWRLQQPAIRASRDGLDLDLTFMPAPQLPSQLRTAGEVKP